MSKIWEALDTLRERGWFQGSSTCQGTSSAYKQVKNGTTCLYIALMLAHGDEWSEAYRRDMDVLRGVCLEYFPERADLDSKAETTIIQVNNHPDTTYGDVETLLEKAAIRSDEVLS